MPSCKNIESDHNCLFLKEQNVWTSLLQQNNPTILGTNQEQFTSEQHSLKKYFVIDKTV